MPKTKAIPPRFDNYYGVPRQWQRGIQQAAKPQRRGMGDVGAAGGSIVRVLAFCGLGYLLYRALKK